MPGTIRPPDGKGDAAALSSPSSGPGTAPTSGSMAVPSSGQRPPTSGSIESPSSNAVWVPIESPSSNAIRPPQLSRPMEGPLTKLCPECLRRFPPEFRVCPHDASDLIDDCPDEEERDDLLGTVVNDTYTLARVLGEGGMGRVYEARHTRLSGKRFAVKVLHPEYTRQPEVVSRFQREAEAAASLKSPHVVGVYDVGKTADGRPFIVAEYLEGKELAEHLEAVGKLPVPEAVRIVRQICKALSLAHEKDVIHRDMKPENVFLTGDMRAPTATVLDFGISKVGDGTGTNLTKTGMIMGTPSYMAPEQARGERVDARADVYAVGAILYAAVTGKRPFDHNDPMVTVTAVLTRDPPPPRELEPSVPEALELVIQRAMAKEPSDRFQSMGELEAELAPWDADATAAIESTQPSATAKRVSTADQKGQAIRMAWPLIVTLTGISGIFLLASIVTVIAALIRVVRGSGVEDLSGTESLLLAVGTFFIFLTPGVLVMRHLYKNVRNNRMREVELADRIRAPIVVALSGYGIATLLVRFLEVVVIRSAVSWGWPAWDLLCFGIAGIGALGTYLLLESEKKRI